MNEYKTRCKIAQAQWLSVLQANPARSLFAGKTEGRVFKNDQCGSIFQTYVNTVHDG